MSENAITRKMFAFSKTLKSLEKNPAKKFTDYSEFTQKVVKKKYKGPLGKAYKENLKKATAAAKAKNLAIQQKRTVKPGQGKFSLPSQKPGSVKPPTIKPASSTMKIKAPAAKEKKVGGDKGRWLDHVDKFRKENPSMSYKEVLIEAKKTYVSVKKIKAPKKQVGVVKAPEPGTTEKKPRKLNKRQLELRFNRSQSSIWYTPEQGKDKFEEWYNSNIKGKRFKDNAEIEAKLNEFVDSVKDSIKEAGEAERKQKKDEEIEKRDKVISDVKEAVGEKGANVIFSRLLFSSEKDFEERFYGSSGPMYGSKVDLPYTGPHRSASDHADNIAEDPKWGLRAKEIAKKYKKLDGYLGKSAGDWLEEYKKEGQNIKTGKTGNVITWNFKGDLRDLEFGVDYGGAGGEKEYMASANWRKGDGRGGYAKNMKRQNLKFDRYKTIEEYYELIRSEMKKDKKKNKE